MVFSTHERIFCVWYVFIARVEFRRLLLIAAVETSDRAGSAFVNASHLLLH